jgi:perosamine synthetase
MNNFIPISKPYITEKEVQYVTDAVQSTWISSLGKYIDTFEVEFARFCDTKYAVSTSNGTVAIHLALHALGIGPGDEVIVPDLSFIATANTVLHAGATPVFVDIDPYNLCIDPAQVEKAVTPRTKAIMPVHLYGHPADMEAINKIAAKHKLIVVEDAAEAHGATIGNKKVGSWGKCGCFSFYGNKNITTGEGGMITTDDEELYQRLRYLRDHAMSKEKRYWHTACGFNYRITNLQAALGCAQMEKADKLIGRRREIHASYCRQLGRLPGVKLNRTYDWATSSYWLICLEAEGFDLQKREELMQFLRSKNIDSRPYFYPMSAMPYFKPANTPITQRVYQTGINLPTFYEITDEQIGYISSVITEYFR